MTDDTLDQDQLRNLAARTAQLPREIDPPADAWAGIKAAIESPQPIAQSPIAPAFWQRPAFLAAAALLLVAGSSAITAIALGDRQNAASADRPAQVAGSQGGPSIGGPSQADPAVTGSVPGPEAATVATNDRPPVGAGETPAAPDPSATGALASGSATPSTLAEFTLLENDYISSANRLAALLESDQMMLSDRTIAKMKESLRVIDAAILEARRALAEDPANRQLIEMLSTTYNQKIDLLRRTTEMGRS
jgi:hypothetical protein